MKYGGFLRHQRSADNIIKQTATKYGVKIYQCATNSNHLHFILRFKRREMFNAFLRVLCSQLAQKIRKGDVLSQPFWSYRPFTRIVNWGRDFHGVKNYVLKNQLEALGIIPHERRKSRFQIELLRNANLTIESRPP